jgi:hypothetical protein
MDTPISESNNEATNSSETEPHVSEEQEKDSETLRSFSESNGNVSELPHNVSERTTEHTLTVHEVAKTFEERGLYITERTILNWCHPNKKGITRLDCYYENREDRYFITPKSTETAFHDELEKRSLTTYFKDKGFENVSESVTNVSEEQAKDSEAERNDSEGNGNVSDSVGQRRTASDASEEPRNEETSKRIKELEQEVIDLKITNKGKDYFIDQLKQDREAVVQEREHLIDRLVDGAKQIGVLETKLMQLEAPRERIIDTEEGSVEGAQDYAR